LNGARIGEAKNPGPRSYKQMEGSASSSDKSELKQTSKPPKYVSKKWVSVPYKGPTYTEKQVSSGKIPLLTRPKNGSDEQDDECGSSPTLIPQPATFESVNTIVTATTSTENSGPLAVELETPKVARVLTVQLPPTPKWTIKDGVATMQSDEEATSSEVTDKKITPIRLSKTKPPGCYLPDAKNHQETTAFRDYCRRINGSKKELIQERTKFLDFIATNGTEGGCMMCESVGFTGPDMYFYPRIRSRDSHLWCQHDGFVMVKGAGNVFVDFAKLKDSGWWRFYQNLPLDTSENFSTSEGTSCEQLEPLGEMDERVSVDTQPGPDRSSILQGVKEPEAITTLALATVLGGGECLETPVDTPGDIKQFWERQVRDSLFQTARKQRLMCVLTPKCMQGVFSRLFNFRTTFKIRPTEQKRWVVNKIGAAMANEAIRFRHHCDGTVDVLNLSGGVLITLQGTTLADRENGVYETSGDDEMSFEDMTNKAKVPSEDFERISKVMTKWAEDTARETKEFCLYNEDYDSLQQAMSPFFVDDGKHLEKCEQVVGKNLHIKINREDFKAVDTVFHTDVGLRATTLLRILRSKYSEAASLILLSFGIGLTSIHMLPRFESVTIEVMTCPVVYTLCELIHCSYSYFAGKLRNEYGTRVGQIKIIYHVVRTRDSCRPQKRKVERQALVDSEYKLTKFMEVNDKGNYVANFGEGSGAMKNLEIPVPKTAVIVDEFLVSPGEKAVKSNETLTDGVLLNFWEDAVGRRDWTVIPPYAGSPGSYTVQGNETFELRSGPDEITIVSGTSLKGQSKLYIRPRYLCWRFKDILEKALKMALDSSVIRVCPFPAYVSEFEPVGLSGEATWDLIPKSKVATNKALLAFGAPGEDTAAAGLASRINNENLSKDPIATTRRLLNSWEIAKLCQPKTNPKEAAAAALARGYGPSCF